MNTDEELKALLVDEHGNDKFSPSHCNAVTAMVEKRDEEIKQQTKLTREIALLEAANLCTKYAVSLLEEKPEFSKVAVECAAIIDDYREQALTINEIGSGSCQELSSFLIKPEIDYGSGLPR